MFREGKGREGRINMLNEYKLLKTDTDSVYVKFKQEFKNALSNAGKVITDNLLLVNLKKVKYDYRRLCFF